MRDFNAFAGTRKQNGVVAHNVAAADGGKANAGRVSLTRDTFSGIHGAVFQVSAQSIGNDLAHFEGSARWRVYLVAVMGLDDFNVITRGQRFGRHFKQFERDIDTHAHVGCHDDGHVFGDGFDFIFLGIGKTGGADDRLDAQGLANFQVRQGAFRSSEVNQVLGVLQACFEIAGDQDATGFAHGSASVSSDSRAAGQIERTREAAIWGIGDGLNEHMAHAARSASNSDSMQERRM